MSGPVRKEDKNEYWHLMPTVEGESLTVGIIAAFLCPDVRQTSYSFPVVPNAVRSSPA
jgi:hypothetical protein